MLNNEEPITLACLLTDLTARTGCFTDDDRNSLAMFSQALDIDFENGGQGEPPLKRAKTTPGGEPRPWLRHPRFQGNTSASCTLEVMEGTDSPIA